MKIQEIVCWLNQSGKNIEFKGNMDSEVTGFSSLNAYKPETVTWIKNATNILENEDSIQLAVVQEGIKSQAPNQIVTSNSKEVFFDIIMHFWGYSYKGGFIGAGTTVSKEAIVSPTAYIGYNCSLIGDVTIGEGTVIENNVVIIGKAIIGDNCHIQSGAVIGVDGFGYFYDHETGSKKMIRHFGSVLIGNDVFIGAHTNIAKGVIDDTVISDGVKIAPSTHIGHNGYIGKNTTVICSELYGSVRIGENSYITASTIENQKSVGSNSIIGMGSVVTKDIDENVIAYGIPAKVIRENNVKL